jgi:hypothetical protein
MPVRAGAFLEREVPGARVLAPMQTSWYLMFASPSSRFLIDGRVPFYGPAHVREVGRALTVPEALAPALERYRVDAVVLEFASSETQVALHTLPTVQGYYPVAIEDDHVLFLAGLPGRERLIERHVFAALPPTLDPAPLLRPDAPVTTMVDELGRLEDDPRARAISSWYRGILGLRTLSRGPGAGFRVPDGPAERQIADAAADDLARAAAHYPKVPGVHAYRALAAVAACRPDEVSAAARAARLEGGNRESIFAEVEMALRSGDGAPAQELLRAAQADPRAAGDPWLAGLSADLEAGVRCP